MLLHLPVAAAFPALATIPEQQAARLSQPLHHAPGLCVLCAGTAAIMRFAGGEGVRHGARVLNEALLQVVQLRAAMYNRHLLLKRLAG